MTEIPKGTITLLFTDIEGSTQLLRTLGNSYEQALLDHRALLRSSFNLFGGQVIDRQGDAFFVVFPRAKDAVVAAIEAQTRLASHPWPNGSELRVRMGIHTGEPSISDEGLTGIAVHWAARICDAAHGGQVLVSSTTCDLIRDQVPEGVVLRDVGEHTFKDFDRPARLYELVAAGPRGSPSAPRTPSRQVDASPLAGANPEPVRDTESLGRRRGRFRLRRRSREPINVIGSRIQYTGRLSPSPELAAGLRSLGGAVVQGGRHLREAERCLRSVDRRELERRLDMLTDGRYLTEEEAQLADDLARQIQALECLEELRPVLDDAIGTSEVRVNAIRREILRARLGHALPDGLVDEVNALCGTVLSLCGELEDAEKEVRHVSSRARSRLRRRAPRNP